jgi:hypothetical protein
MLFSKNKISVDSLEKKYNPIYGKCSKCGEEVSNELGSLKRLHLNCKLGRGEINYLKKCAHKNVEYNNWGDGCIPWTGAKVLVDKFKCLDCGLEPTKRLWTQNMTELWRYFQNAPNRKNNFF